MNKIEKLKNWLVENGYKGMQTFNTRNMANITVYEFMYLNTEDCAENFLLWDIGSCDYIYEGDIYSMPKEYEDLTVESWNIAYSNKANCWVVCLNVNLED